MASLNFDCRFSAVPDISSLPARKKRRVHARCPRCPLGNSSNRTKHRPGAIDGHGDPRFVSHDDENSTAPTSCASSARHKGCAG